MNQVHKENLLRIENAKSEREGINIEIFGMEGIPEEVKAAHEQIVIREYYDAQAERARVTGNPPAGQSNSQPKLPKLESGEELKNRVQEQKAKREAEKRAATVSATADNQVNPQTVSTSLSKSNI